MPILTLTTDFGTNNFYLASFKGMILSYLHTVQIIDVSHTTAVFDIQSSAFQLQNTWKSFPQHTVHFVQVGEQYANKQRFIATEFENQYFVLPDNGMITLILQDYPSKVIPILPNEHFETKTQFLAQIVTDILKNQSIDFLGKPTNQYVERLSPKPIVSDQLIRGTIQYIDRYGNLITNIDKKLFDHLLGENGFEIITRSGQFNQISDTYTDVDQGDMLCLFNSLQLLQISINEGNASELLGLKIGDQIQVEFH